ncbi:MAG TPA: hypothetical protein VFB06_34495 [Streptosporangiaceae bacterium]|nr:hypothetical protein [Streptosporangiaceae bacterium]
MDTRKWCVRAFRESGQAPPLSYPVSLHRTWLGAHLYRRRITDREQRRMIRQLLAGYAVDQIEYRVARATNRDRAELDGWVS